MFLGDAMDFYESWPKPVCIVSDGAYGIDGFEGDTKSHFELKEWYRPHVEKWSRFSRSDTTLWLWNTEIGWANVHPLLEENGWKYVRCCIWDKGMAHLAGNVNTETIRQFPCVSEVCVQYVRNATADGIEFRNLLRGEWKRTGLPFYKANDACGVKNAASRKYLSNDGEFYLPSTEMLFRMRNYANLYGNPANSPYFDFVSEKEDSKPKFRLPFGFTNVWHCLPVSGKNRIKNRIGKNFHPNQKPISLMKMIVDSCTDEGDVVWEPFGGLFTASLAASRNNRIAYGSEISEEFFDAGKSRFLPKEQLELFS